LTLLAGFRQRGQTPCDQRLPAEGGEHGGGLCP
jgi:hypothetical protein